MAEILEPTQSKDISQSTTNLQNEETQIKDDKSTTKDSNKNNSSHEMFINEQEQMSLIKGWQQSVKKEKSEQPYAETRREGGSSGIEYIHNESFLDYIQNEIEKGGTPVKVLDIGGGIGVYAEQIRKKFGEKVRVFTTGLSRSHVAKQRKSNNIKLPNGEEIAKQKHNDDLVCQSILQMRNFPEFDLIIDTYAEQYYIDYRFLDKYFEAIVSKLQKGGKASIAPLDNISLFNTPDNPLSRFTEIKEKLESKHPVRVSLTYESSAELELIKQQIKEVKANNNRISKEGVDALASMMIDEEKLLQNPMQVLLKQLKAREKWEAGQGVLKIEKLK